MIETPLALLPLDCDAQEICDWFELYTLSSEFHSSSFSDLSRQWDKRKNSEEFDFQALAGQSEEEFLEAIYQAVRERIKCLSDSYPFSISENGEEFIFRNDDLNEGSIIYIFCLFIANTNNKVIFDNDSFFTINNYVRDLFQACATWAAAGEVIGNSYSFGFPRPDNSGFLPKLTTIYQHFADGKVRDTPLPGVSINPKDEQMDVIAWSHQPDGAVGTYYLLGQVATGKNWKNKSVKGSIDPFHRIWFERQPASTATPAMFIPFNILPTKNESFRDKLYVLTQCFGNVYYRYRVPYLAKKGLELGRNNDYLTIERLDDIHKVREWVHKVIDDFRSRCVYA